MPHLLSMLFLSAFISIVLLVTANFFPDIDIDEYNLNIRFLWMRLSTSFSDLVAIKPSLSLLSRIFRPSSPAVWVVATKRLSLFHRLYGLIYGFWRHPSFTISNSIENYDNLISLLRA